MSKNKDSPEERSNSSRPKTVLQSSGITEACGGYSASPLEGGRREPEKLLLTLGHNSAPYKNARSARCITPPLQLYGLGFDKCKFHLKGLWHLQESATHVLDGQEIKVRGLQPEGFRKLRNDSPSVWVRESCARSFPRWSHDATGVVISGNCLPRFLEISVGRIIHGMNLFTVNQDQVSSFPEHIREKVIPICSGVVNEAEVGELTSLELFVNLPLSGRVLDLLNGRANSCFRSHNEHKADFGHYRRGSQKTLVVYMKSAELLMCQGYTAVELRRRNWGNVLRVELRLRGKAQVGLVLHPGSPARVECLCLQSCYRLIRRHVVAYDIAELSAFFPADYDEFQRQNWKLKQC